MTYWILMFRPETYEQAREKNLIGVLNSHRKRFANLSPGDKFVAYVSRICEFDALGEVVGRPYQDDTPVYPGWERYTRRCQVRFHVDGAHLGAKELLFELSSFQGPLKTHPANLIFCRGGFMEISMEDYGHLQTLIVQRTQSRAASDGRGPVV